MNWLDQNDSYLSASLVWLRARLRHFIDAGASHPSNGRDGTIPPGLRQLAAAREEAAEISPPPALIVLSHRLGLSEFELNVLLLCAAMELDTRIAALCAQAQDDVMRPYPTFALALALFDRPHWDALAAHTPLRHWRLIELSQTAVQPLTATALKIDERILNFIKGLNHLDSRLAPLLTASSVAASALPPSQRAIADRLEAATLKRSTDPMQVMQLLGSDGESKRMVAADLARRFGLTLYRLPVNALPSHSNDLDVVIRLWEREQTLLPSALYIDAQYVDRSPDTDGPVALLGRFLEHARGLVFVGTREALPILTERSALVDVGKPTPAEQQEAWGTVLSGDAVRARELAFQFDLNIDAIQRMVRLHNATGDHQVWDACVSALRPQLDTLAQRIDAKATWPDLVLPPEETDLLRTIARQVRHRGRVYDQWGFSRRMNRGLGITALFTGDSGTGKTMAAEVIANDLRLNLYRIDLSAVVNKYIGETEKNLRRVFDAAENGGAILFFDEADALFGKRSEVKDSHDRYANIEINYLLQRMEAYRGLAILATNMKSALDPAFMRRIRFIVNFPFPSHVERGLIWKKVFPAETPLDALDPERLARLNLTGGNIHTIALNAAFMAAQEDTPVSMPIVFAAVRTEFRKLERPINEADFR